MSAGQAERLALTLADGECIELRQVHDPRARRLRLSVSERGARLTVPPGLGAEAARRFAQAHGEWLRGQLARFKAAAPEPLQLGADEDIPLLGASLPLRWAHGRFALAQREGETLRLQLPDGADARMARLALRQFYHAQAQAWLGPVLARWLPQFSDPAPRAVRIRPLRSLWGSLSPDNRVSLDLALILAPPAAFEYVLLHELCHLRHRHHRPTFWRAVAQCCPDYEDQRAWFRTHGSALKAQCQRLTADA